MRPAVLIEDLVEAEHPSIPGHFPGHPIVPGVLLLSRVMAAIEKFFPQVDVVAARTVRFHKPLVPGERFSVHLRRDDTSLRFEVIREGERMASGQFLLRAEGRAADPCEV